MEEITEESILNKMKELTKEMCIQKEDYIRQTEAIQSEFGEGIDRITAMLLKIFPQAADTHIPSQKSSPSSALASTFQVSPPLNYLNSTKIELSSVNRTIVEGDQFPLLLDVYEKTRETCFLVEIKEENQSSTFSDDMEIFNSKESKEQNQPVEHSPSLYKIVSSSPPCARRPKPPDFDNCDHVSFGRNKAETNQASKDNEEAKKKEASVEKNGPAPSLIYDVDTICQNGGNNIEDVAENKCWNWGIVAEANTMDLRSISYNQGSIIGGDDGHNYYLKELNNYGQLLTPGVGNVVVSLGKKLLMLEDFIGTQNLDDDIDVLDVDMSVWSKVLTIGEGPSASLPFPVACLVPHSILYDYYHRGPYSPQHVGNFVHGLVLKHGGFVQMCTVRVSLTYFYVTCGRLEDVYLAFDEMLKRDVVAWTVIIYRHVQDKKSGRVLEYFCNMHSVGFDDEKLNPRTLECGLQACAHLGALQEGMCPYGFHEDTFSWFYIAKGSMRYKKRKRLKEINERVALTKNKVEPYFKFRILSNVDSWSSLVYEHTQVVSIKGRIRCSWNDKARAGVFDDANSVFHWQFIKLGSSKTRPKKLTFVEVKIFGRLDIDPTSITWRRVMDINDWFLKKITIEHRLGDKEMTSEIYVASEFMAVLVFTTSLGDMREKLGKMVMGRSKAGNLITTVDLNVRGDLTILETLERTPILVLAKKSIHPAKMKATAEWLVSSSPKPEAHIIYIGGAFDLSHAGHVEILSRTRELGDFLRVEIHNNMTVSAHSKPVIYPPWQNNGTTSKTNKDQAN